MPGNFDAIAPFYDSLSRLVFGNALRNSQLDTLHFIPVQAAVLIIGGGSGWYLKELLQTKPLGKIVYVEASASMLRLSRKKAAQVHPSASIDFRLGTETSIQPGEQFDVVITHFLLDLFPEAQVKGMIQTITKALHPDGIWLCSDFQIDKENPGHWWQKGLITAMYGFFRLSCGIEAGHLPELSKQFSFCNFHCLYESLFFHKMISARVYQKKNTGRVTGSES